MLAIEYGYMDIITRLIEHRIGLDAPDRVSDLSRFVSPFSRMVAVLYTTLLDVTIQQYCKS